MKRQREFLNTSTGVVSKKSRRSSLAATQTIPRPLGLSGVQKAQVNRLITANEEIKIFDVFAPAQAISIAPASSSISTIGLGTGASQRVGNEIKLLSCGVRYSLLAGDNTNKVRIIFWSYKQNSALAAASHTFILQPFPSSGTYEVESPYNYDNKKLYKIHYDKVHDLVLSADSSLQSVYARFKIPKSVQKVDFNTGVATGNNLVYVTWLSDSAATTHPSVNMTTRLYYTDA